MCAAGTLAEPGSLAARTFAVPRLQVRERVDRVPACGLPAPDPDLEVQVGRGGRAGLADLSQGLAGRDRLPRAYDKRSFLEVREHEVEADVGVLARVVAGAARLVARTRDNADKGGEHGGAFGAQHVLALVHVAGALGPETIFGAAEAVRAGDREHRA